MHPWRPFFRRLGVVLLARLELVGLEAGGAALLVLAGAQCLDVGGVAGLHSCQVHAVDVDGRPGLVKGGLGERSAGRLTVGLLLGCKAGASFLGRPGAPGGWP